MYSFILITLFAIRYAAGRSYVLNKQLYWVVFLGLFIFSAFRFRVGCDWSGYYFNYLIGSDLSYDVAQGYREPLWWLIQVALNDWGAPYPAVNVLTSAIFFIGVHMLAMRQIDRLGFLVLLFPILIVNMPMSGIRQAAAIGFLCLSFVAFIDKSPMKYIFWILLGSSIHSSVIVFLLLAPLATGRYTSSRMLLSFILALPGAYFISQSEMTQEAVSRYVIGGIDAFGAVFRVGILTLSGCLFFLKFRGNWARYFPGDYGLVSAGAISMIILLPFVGVSTVVSDRLGYYLVPLQAIVFARIPYLNLEFNHRLFSALPYLVLTFVFIVWSWQSSIFDLCYIPYQSWFLGHVDFGLMGF